MSTMKVITSENEGVFRVYLMGKSKWKPKAAARCATPEERDAKAAEFQAEIDRHDAEQAAKRAARSAAKRAALESAGNPYKLGDVLSNSWGYDQTNVDFYEVVEVGARSVVIRPIASELVPDEAPGGAMSGMVRPKPGNYCGKPVRKTLQVWVDHEGKAHGEPRITTEHGSFRKYDGQPLYCSWYA